MPRNWNTAPGNTPIQDGHTIRLNPNGVTWESHKFADTKADVGLSSVDNTSDANKPVSTATQAALDDKADVNELADVAFTGEYEDLLNKPFIPPEAPVDSVNGKTGVVTLDHSDVGADEVGSATQALDESKDYTDSALGGLSTVAHSGSYDDLIDKPTIPAEQVNADWESASGKSEILNKPSLGSAAEANVEDFATDEQGELADTAIQPEDLATIATTGSYNDLDDKPSIPDPQIQSDWNQTDNQALDYIKNKPTYSQSTASRSLNSIFRPSTTRNSFVTYSVRINCTASLSGGQEGQVHLEISSTSDFSSDVTNIATIGNRNAVSLAIALTANQDVIQNIVGTIPSGYYVRLRTQQVTGSPTFSYVRGQESLI